MTNINKINGIINCNKINDIINNISIIIKSVAKSQPTTLITNTIAITATENKNNDFI